MWIHTKRILKFRMKVFICYDWQKKCIILLKLKTHTFPQKNNSVLHPRYVKGYCCESDTPFYKWHFIWNYVYNSFKRGLDENLLWFRCSGDWWGLPPSSVKNTAPAILFEIKSKLFLKTNISNREFLLTKIFNLERETL